MSETNRASKSTDAEQFKAYMAGFELDEAAERGHEEKLGELAEKVRSGEAPYSMEELQELSRGVGEEWQEDGYSAGTSFVDGSGRLVMLARPQGETGTSLKKSEKTWRVLFDDATETVTIPSEFAGRSMHFRGSGGYDTVYDARHAEEGAELPEDMQRLVDKFGPHLTRSHKQGRHYLEAEAGDFWSLSELANEVSRPEREAYAADWDEAHRMEREAQRASSAVRKKLFMTARRHAQLQEKAYRDSIRR